MTAGRGSVGTETVRAQGCEGWQASCSELDVSSEGLAGVWGPPGKGLPQHQPRRTPTLLCVAGATFRPRPPFQRLPSKAQALLPPSGAGATWGRPSRPLTGQGRHLQAGSACTVPDGQPLPASPGRDPVA